MQGEPCNLLFDNTYSLQVRCRVEVVRVFMRVALERKMERNTVTTNADSSQSADPVVAAVEPAQPNANNNN